MKIRQYLTEITGRFGHGTKLTSYGRERTPDERAQHRSDDAKVPSNRADGTGPTADERTARKKKAAEIAAKLAQEGKDTTTGDQKDTTTDDHFSPFGDGSLSHAAWKEKQAAKKKKETNESIYSKKVQCLVELSELPTSSQEKKVRDAHKSARQGVEGGSDKEKALDDRRDKLLGKIAVKDGRKRKAQIDAQNARK